MKLTIITVSLWMTSHLATAQTVKVPSTIRLEAKEIEGRFQAALLEECPDQSCYLTGCKTTNFLTLDQNQDASLPGLESTPTQKQVQYKLQSVLCQFSYEPLLTGDAINKLKQRLAARTNTVGVRVAIQATKLSQKVNSDELEANESAKASNQVPLTLRERVLEEVLPFIPWLMMFLSFFLFLMGLIWGWRRLGKPKKKTRAGLRTRATDVESTNEVAIAEMPEPTTLMLTQRNDQLKETLEGDRQLVEFTLKPYFEQKNFEELCLFLRYFGPELLDVFREKAEYRDALGHLGQVYTDFEEDDNGKVRWAFLERLERSIVSAKVKINNQPLTEEFAFLGSIVVDELVGLLKEVSDLEAVATIAYAPQDLKEKFFTVAPAKFTASIVEKLTRVDKLSDSFVRQTARKLRKLYNEKAKEYETISVNRDPLIEVALNRLDETNRKQLISNLQQNDPQALKSLAPSLFLDESLKFLKEEIVTEAFLEVTPMDAASYLRRFDWKDEVLQLIKARLREPIEKFLVVGESDDSGAIRARERIADYIRRKAQEGIIDIASINREILG